MNEIIDRGDVQYLYGGYNEDRPRMVYNLCLLGCTLEEIAAVMNVTVSTIESWRKKHKEFAVQMAKGRTLALGEVTAALFKKAVGYDYDQEVAFSYKGEITKTTVKKHVPPDPWAAAKILAMKKPEIWSGTHRIDHTHTNVNINKFDFSGISTEELELLQKIIEKQHPKELGENKENKEG